MKHRAALIIAVLGASLSAPLAGQAAINAPTPSDSVAVRECVAPKVPIGMLSPASGTIQFVLRKDGKPDTTAVEVTNVSGISAAGLRSVAVRTLSGCRFESGEAVGSGVRRVTATVRLDGMSPVVGAAYLSPSPEAGLAILPLDIPLDSFPLAIDDARLEERPRRLRCADPPLPPGGTRQQLTEQLRAWREVWAGRLAAKATIGVDGRPDRRVMVISTSNPVATQNLVNLLLGCVYVAGRYHGIPVPAFVRDSIGVVSGGER